MKFSISIIRQLDRIASILIPEGGAVFARWTRWRWPCLVVILLITASPGIITPAPSVAAQSDLRYFAETGHYLRGAFRAYWERNGGVAIFGFPITEEYRRSDGRIVQWFQRARFELAQANPPVVQLGHLGREFTGDRIFPQAPPQPSTARIRYFPETNHTLRGLFKETWERRGGLAIFGYPISEEISENINGQWTLVQYFERHRFELRLFPSRVEFGLLGEALAPAQLRAPWPPNIAPDQPLNEDGTPLPPPFRPGLYANARVIAEADQTFRIEGEGFRPGERVRFLLSSPECECRPTTLEPQPLADVNGSISYAQVRFNTRDYARGRWYLTAQGQTSNRAGIAQFFVGVAPPVGQPGGVFVGTTPQTAGFGQAVIVQGSGFQPNEPVSLWLTAPDQSVRGIPESPTADGSGSISGANIRIAIDTTFRVGTWFITAQGRSSGRQAIGTFRVEAGAPPPAQRPGDPARLGILIHNELRVSGAGSITPLAAPPGAGFVFNASGFDPNEKVGVWLTRPAGAGVEPIDERLVQRKGSSVRVAFRVDRDQQGIWTVTAQGASTGRAVTAPFKLTRDYVAPLGTPRPATSRNASVSPAEGGQRTTFRLTASGFRANETLEFWVTSPDGLYVLNTPVQADNRGRIGVSPALGVQLGARNPPGVYGYHYRGTISGVRTDIYFTFTGAP
jgi:hypothetical protein